MYTGIVAGRYPVTKAGKLPGLLRYSVELPQELLAGLKIGASVSIAGACQTVVTIEGAQVVFDAMEETLRKTTLQYLEEGDLVNVERSAKIGDEIGGHVVSGHVFGMATIGAVDTFENNRVVTFKCPQAWMKYILPKGFIALDGASLTIVDTDAAGSFRVSFIPETLRLTTFGLKGEGDFVNVEIDPQTQAIVDTVERVMSHTP